MWVWVKEEPITRIDVPPSNEVDPAAGEAVSAILVIAQFVEHLTLHVPGRTMLVHH